jgi:hypothetical protein
VNDRVDGLGEAAPAGGEFLPIVQNPKTPAEVLEKLLRHPDLPAEAVMAALRHPNTPAAAMVRLAARASGRILDVLLGSLERLGRWIEALEALLENPNLPVVKQPTIRQAIEVAKKREADGARKKSLLLQI